jgi:hypothetical protein
MKRLNVMLSDEAKEVIIKYQKEKQISTLDEAADAFILEKK